MTEQSRHPDADDAAIPGHAGDLPPRVPRWVWVSALVVGALIAIAVVVMLLSGGQHGPGTHMSIGVKPESGSGGDIAIAPANCRG